jgi:cytochrome P450
LLHPITTLSGERLTSIRIRKGQIVHLPIENLNMAQSIWGPDAREFKPERWVVRGDPTDPALVTGTAVPACVGEGPGVWSNLMTFIDGPRRCVGYKLGIMQMKIILYTLIRDFEFAAVPGKRIYKTNMCVRACEPGANGAGSARGHMSQPSS